MVETALFESDCILFVTVATSDKKSVDSPIPDNKLSNDEDTLPMIYAFETTLYDGRC